jgi:hypothetical protein
MERFLALFAAGAALAVPAVAVGGSGGSSNATACVFTAQLRAENETPPTTSTATGHTQIKIRNDSTLEFSTDISNPDAETFVAAHVHNAPVGVAGAIVVPLFSGSTSDTHIVQDAAVPIDPGLAAAICADPADYYVNYHTTQFPAGAIRGQLG